MSDGHVRSVRDKRTHESPAKANARMPPPPTEQFGSPRPGDRQSATQLSEAIHDLRQPLQALFLLASLLAKTVNSAAAQKLVARIDVSLTAMASILDGVAVSPQSPHETSEPNSRPKSDRAHALLQSVPPPDSLAATLPASIIYVVDDDEDVLAALRSVLEDDGHEVSDFASCEAFLECERRSSGSNAGCLLVDAYLPGMSGLELIRRLHYDEADALPAIMITGRSDVPMAVDAMKAGAVDFIEKPIDREGLLTCIRCAVEQSRDQTERARWQQEAKHLVDGLTVRQHEIMDLVLAGVPNKNIAADLSISQRTVENHRAAIMRKTGVKSLPALARLAVTALSARSLASHTHINTL
jgi:FixJ family two-component response regulator